MKLAVLNPGGNDPNQAFSDFAGAPDDARHAPVNYHAFAACTGGGFYKNAGDIPEGARAVLLLIRHDLRATRRAIVGLRRMRKTIAVAWKEAGAMQVAAQLGNAANVELFRDICGRADGAIATTPDLVPLFQSAGVTRAEFIPTPYPIDDERWDFSLRDQEPRGIFLGTREFKTPSRNHLAALMLVKRLAEGMGEPVTVFNTDGWRGRRILRSLGYAEGMLRVVESRLPYPKYLRAVSKHRFVFQLDASAVPGQVAGDALLARVPCVGGNGVIDRLAFSGLCGLHRGHEALFDLAARLLEHPHDCATAVSDAMENARATLSFEMGRKALENFFVPLLR